MKKLLLLINLISVSITAQTFDVHIKDAKSLEPLPYTTIRFLHSQNGFYSNENGLGIIDKADLNDTLIISYVGYYEKQIPIKLLEKNNNILLEQKGFTLNEVVVKNDVLIKKPLYIGTLREPTNMNFYFGRNKITEFAIKVEIPENIEFYRVQKIVVGGIIKGKKNNPIRLHLYDDNDGYPGVELLTKDVLADNVLIAKKGKLEIDISKINVKSNDRILYVGIESIITSNSNKPENITDLDQGIYFTTKLSKEITFMRGLSSLKWYPFNLKLKGDKNYCNLKAGIQIQQLKE